MQQRVAWAVFVIAVVVGALLWARPCRSHDSVDSPHPATRVARGSAALAAEPGPPTAHTHVTRLATPAERRAVADRIAAAASSHASRPGAPPALPDDGHDLDRASTKLKAALEEAIPFLAECYQTGSARERRPAVLLTLTGDEVSALVDADQLVDPDGKPLDPELEACLRSTLTSLELPPLGNTAPIHLKYSFQLDG